MPNVTNRTLQISSQKIVRALVAFEKGMSARSLYKNPGDPANMGKATVHKLKRLWVQGQLGVFARPDTRNQATLRRLAQLNDPAIELLNRRMTDDGQTSFDGFQVTPLFSRQKLNSLIRDYEAWNKRVVIELGNLSVVESQRWTRRRAIPISIGNFPHAINPKHQYYLRIIAAGITRLDSLIFEYDRASRSITEN